jgi:hypothetical protein
VSNIRPQQMPNCEKLIQRFFQSAYKFSDGSC